jgi:hypothetical protein
MNNILSEADLNDRLSLIAYRFESIALMKRLVIGIENS